MPPVFGRFSLSRRLWLVLLVAIVPLAALTFHDYRANRAKAVEDIELHARLLVQRVQGLAARAGVQPGDVIVGVNNIALTSADQLREQVAAAKSGDTLALRLIRDGNTLFVAVPVAEK